MTYQYRILRDYPLHAYPLNAGETAPADVSGNAYPSSLTTAPVTGPPLVVGGGNSVLISSTNRFQFTTPVFTGDVRKPFTLEAWFKPVATGSIVILGHTGNKDGIKYDGETIRFGTSHGAAGVSEAVYYVPEVSDSFHVVAVHSATKNQLYVNSVLVAESSITDAQIAAGYDNADAILYSGTAITGTPSVLLDAVAVYALVLSPPQILNHFHAGREAPDFRDVVASRGGISWDFTDNSAAIGYEKLFNTDESWREGIPAGVNIQSGTVTPSFDDAGLSVTGYWTFGQLYTVPSPLGGSKIEWDGDGNFTVEVSLDNGTTYTPCVNGREIPGLTEGTAVATGRFIIRILFPSGEASDTITKVRWLSMKLYNDRNLTQVVGGRTIDLTGNVALASNVHQLIELHDDTGLDLYNGTAIISADTSQVPLAVRVVDMWVKPYTNTTVANLTTLTGATTYVNGLAATALTAGQWAHVTAVLGADHQAAFTIKTGVQIASLALYSTTMTAADVLALYSAYVGNPAVRLNDLSVITITSPDNGIKLYQYDWTPASA